MNSCHQTNGGINSGQSSLSLLSKSCSYRNISSGGGFNAPPKPLRTYTHNLQRQSSVPPEMMDYSSIVESMLTGSAVNNGGKCSIGYNSQKEQNFDNNLRDKNLRYIYIYMQRFFLEYFFINLNHNQKLILILVYHKVVIN